MKMLLAIAVAVLSACQMIETQPTPAPSDTTRPIVENPDTSRVETLPREVLSGAQFLLQTKYFLYHYSVDEWNQGTDRRTIGSRSYCLVIDSMRKSEVDIKLFYTLLQSSNVRTFNIPGDTLITADTSSSSWTGWIYNTKYPDMTNGMKIWGDQAPLLLWNHAHLSPDGISYYMVDDRRVEALNNGSPTPAFHSQENGLLLHSSYYRASYRSPVIQSYWIELASINGVAVALSLDFQKREYNPLPLAPEFPAPRTLECSR